MPPLTAPDSPIRPQKWLWGALFVLAGTIGVFAMSHADADLSSNDANGQSAVGATATGSSELARADLPTMAQEPNSAESGSKHPAKQPVSEISKRPPSAPPATAATSDSNVAPLPASDLRAIERAVELQNRSANALREKYPVNPSPRGQSATPGSASRPATPTQTSPIQ
jgi:hypothetical protein